MEKLVVETWYSQMTPVTLELGEYGHGGCLAVSLRCDEGPFATLTVNLACHKPPHPYSYVDTNNCPWAPAFLEKYGLAEPTGDQAQSGYCWYPLYKFNMDKIQAYIEGGNMNAG